MATEYTTNYNLKKPDYTDDADIFDINDNMDEIDAQLYSVSTGKKPTQTAVADPSADGTGVEFLDSITQNENGVITPHKKTVRTMTGANGSAAGTAGLVPAPAASDNGKYFKGDGTWGTPTNTDTKNTAGATDTGSKIFLIGATSQEANPQTYSHDTAYVGTDGCLYSGGTKVLTGHQSLDGCVKTSGNQSVAGVKTFSDTTDSSSTTTGAVKVSGGLGVAKNIYGNKVWNGVWNDYAECREADETQPGRCVRESIRGVMVKTDRRRMRGCRIISDTFGSCMGETAKAKTPVGVAGRVLAYPARDRRKFHLGDPVCSGPNGTVDVMSRLEAILFPECIIGTVSEIPNYEKWIAGTKRNPKEINVDGRIWVYVR